jgi:OOP family OmpA-OmpF porin
MDGVPDKKDNCPDTPMGAIVDERGCPIDTDGDGVFDGLDKCPGTPAGATVDNTGCPKDTDADGVLDGIDKCASTSKGATVDATGCPQDTDNDGIFDGLDKCPDTRAGARVDATGCEIKEIEFEFLSKERLELYVNFKSGSAEIMDESKPLLNDVGGILVKWSEVRVEIAGHTDSQGGEDFNMKLSQKRAESVRDYLLQNFPSIGQDRMLAQGYGEMQPIAPNDTKEGMAKNRRVEVKVLNPETLKKALPEQ